MSNVCPKCGEPKEISKKDRLLRKMVGANAMLFPSLHEVCDEAKGYCNDCWKEAVMPVAQGAARNAGVETEILEED